jgi:uncharacterized Zn finger protein
MCKHVAAVLYGVGARLDAEPELLFKLRHVDHLELINTASFKAAPKSSSKTSGVKEQDLSQLFGIEIEATAAVETTVKRTLGKTPVKKTAARKQSTRKPGIITPKIPGEKVKKPVLRKSKAPAKKQQRVKK